MSNNPLITRAKSHHIPQVASVIATAFQHLDVATWLVPDESSRHSTLLANMTIWVEHALRHGFIDVAEHFDAVAVWFPQPLDTEPPDYDQRLEDACGKYTKNFQLLDETFAAHHPHSTDHHHLAFLAVLPSEQNKGLGSALLHHHQETHPQISCYLEASSRQSRDLYLRHGYHVLEGPFSLPDGPSLWPMWRDPHDQSPC